MDRNCKQLVSVMLSVLLLGNGLVMAGNNSGEAFRTWPDTSQSKCYGSNGNEPISCPEAGQPYYGQDAQHIGHTRSYTDIGNGTVRDNITGLIWENKTNMDGIVNYADPHDADNKYHWCDPNPDTNGGVPGYYCENDYSMDTMDFLNQLNDTNFGGYDDWRIPTIKELLTLADMGRFDPAIDPLFVISSSPSPTYWSASSDLSTRSYALTVIFYQGHVVKSSKTGGNYARGVRGGQ